MSVSGILGLEFDPVGHQKPVTIWIAGPPVGKGRPRFARKTGHAFTPEKTRRYEDLVRLVAQEQMLDRAPLEGPVKISVVAVFPVPGSWSRRKQAAALAGHEKPTKRPDVDNLIKLIGDSLNEIVYRDDAQIVEATVRKAYGSRPGIAVVVEALATLASGIAA